MQKSVLSILGISPSTASRDYLQNKQQFQLHSLLTEQRHPRTWNLSVVIKEDVTAGLEELLSVDEDIFRKLDRLAEDPDPLERAVAAVRRALEEGDRIFVYGCGSTGRLAKQMESALWRPFWKRIKTSSCWERLQGAVPEGVEDLLIGEMTGGDRALISALEGFEDLQLVGELQLKDRGIRRGDVVFAVTEGGETSSVIGAVLAALGQYGNLTPETIREAASRLFFIYNNPDELLKPYERSRQVLENPGISKINLTTGPQAITGSTRMQATTIETFVLGAVLEAAVQGFLAELLDPEELPNLGFNPGSDLSKRLKSFQALLSGLWEVRQELSRFIRMEADTYTQRGRSCYCAGRALITVFIDCAERSPTFHLHPLDTISEDPSKSWVQVGTPAEDRPAAWKNFLGRPFRGLESDFYRPHFERRISDTYLKATAMSSLAQAGSGQQELYDFSLSEENIRRFAPGAQDLGVVVLMDEEAEALKPRSSESAYNGLLSELEKQGAKTVLLLLGEIPENLRQEIRARLKQSETEENHLVHHIPVAKQGDPMGLEKQTLLKMLLNNHSTAVMALLGRVVGNTMTDVNPSNLKLIGRATFLIQSHVNDCLKQPGWHDRYGPAKPLSYAEANAILFDALESGVGQGTQLSEVAVSIIRILEALRLNRPFTWEEAVRLAEDPGLEEYLGSGFLVSSQKGQ